MGPNRVGLEHHADGPLFDGHGLARRTVVNHFVSDQDPTRGRRLEPGDATQNGRLAAAARSQQRHDLTFMSGKGDAVDRTGAWTELFRQALYSDLSHSEDADGDDCD